MAGRHNICLFFTDKPTHKDMKAQHKNVSSKVKLVDCYKKRLYFQQTCKKIINPIISAHLLKIK